MAGKGIAQFAGGGLVSTLYQCGGCQAIVTTVWNWSGQQLCRQCFGRARGFDSTDYSSGLNPRSTSVRLVKADGTVQDLDAKPKPKVPAADAPNRKFRFPQKGEEE